MGCRSPPTPAGKVCTALGSGETEINEKPSSPGTAHSLAGKTDLQPDSTSKDGAVVGSAQSFRVAGEGGKVE